MRILITGASGFVGGHLVDYLRRRQSVDLFGTYCGDTPDSDRLADVEMFEVDLRRADDVARVVADVAPEVIFHLAAQSFVPASWERPAETLEINVIGQTHLFEAARALPDPPRIHVAGSAEVYGRVSEGELPVSESTPLRPLSPYAVSKAAQDLLAYQYAVSRDLPIVRTRAFNHTGPGQRDLFVAPSFARQVAAIEAGAAEPVIRVGDLTPVRDFLDVRDVVEAYWLVVMEGTPGAVYNVASGDGIAIQEILDRLVALATVDVRVEVDPARLRPAEMKTLIGDNRKLVEATGWRRTLSLEQTLTDLLDEWRARYRG